METTYTQEQAKLLAQDYVKVWRERGAGPTPQRHGALAWIRFAYPGFNRKDHVAFLKAFDEAIAPYLP